MKDIKLYNNVNNTFKKKIIFHVGTGAGFYSEINGMLTAMLYCYVHRIKFILYADDANFAGGNGWNEFFMPFCQQSHDRLNHRYNMRSRYEGENIPFYSLGRLALKLRNGVNYLTDDIFGKACLGNYSRETTAAKWQEFHIDGDINKEFVKLRSVALHYNRKTFAEIKEMIEKLKLPAHYYSVQFRGGDKTLEVTNPMDVDYVIERIKNLDIKIDNIFIFSDDYYYVDEIKRKCPEWNVYTLTRQSEHGYINSDFNKCNKFSKRREMIKLFAMTEICLHSDIHFGCEVACVNDYIKNIKSPDKYRAVWTEDDAVLKDGFGTKMQQQYG